MDINALITRLSELMKERQQLKQQRIQAAKEARKIFLDLKLDQLPPISLPNSTFCWRVGVDNDGLLLNYGVQRKAVEMEEWLEAAIKSAESAASTERNQAEPMIAIRDMLLKLKNELQAD